MKHHQQARKTRPSYGAGFERIANKARTNAFPNWYSEEALVEVIGNARS